jgi:GNAT superfamily N-acetyltransferase
MKRLWVSGEFRGLRIGRFLVEEALAWAKRQGFDAMYLDTVPAAMPEANRMYSSLGFLPVERYNRNFINGVEFFRRPICSV